MSATGMCPEQIDDRGIYWNTKSTSGVITDGVPNKGKKSSTTPT